MERQNLTMRTQMREIHAPHKRIQQEIGGPKSSSRATLRSLQLLPGAFESENHSGDGCRDFGSVWGVEQLLPA